MFRCDNETGKRLQKHRNSCIKTKEITMDYKIIYGSLLKGAIWGVVSIWLFWFGLCSGTVVQVLLMGAVFVISILLIQSESWIETIIKSGTFVVSMILMFIISLKIDAFHVLFKMLNPEYGKMNAGTGFGLLFILPSFVAMCLISIVIAVIFTLIRKKIKG